jgi:hypothetical protein
MNTSLPAQLRGAGWFELSRPYPDRGPLYDVHWYNALLRIGVGGCGAVVAANADGLRVSVVWGRFALFMPWSEAAVSAHRGWLNTVVRVRTSAVPDTPLVLHLDDDEADALLRPAAVALAPRRWTWGPAVWTAAAVGLLVVLVGAVLVLGAR